MRVGGGEQGRVRFLVKSEGEHGSQPCGQQPGKDIDAWAEARKQMCKDKHGGRADNYEEPAV